MESVCLDRGESHLKDELMPRYAELIYNGKGLSQSPRSASLIAHTRLTHLFFISQGSGSPQSARCCKRPLISAPKT